MKISTDWLADLVDVEMLGVGTDQLAAALTTVGFAVEGVEQIGEATVFDLDVTTNRPDCLSHLGIAREVAACFRLPLQPPDGGAPPGEADPALEAGIGIEDPDLCPRYSARLIADVAVVESPDWMKRRLESLGQRPINNVVDVTNYVLFELGHPLHAFDHDLLDEGRIVVRRAAAGEKITTLDGVERDTDPEMLLICDAARPVAVGGVMGGADSEVSPQTRAILLESAYFLPSSVRRTSKRLGLRSEASFRFERGADPEMPVIALNRATRLLVELCGGRVVGDVIDENPSPHVPAELQLRHSRVEQVVGTPIEPADVRDILEGLQFQPREDEGTVTVTVPSFRVDVGIEDDLVEEVARHYGYDRVTSRYPAPSDAGRYLDSEDHDRYVARTLTAGGFFEAYSFSFTTPARETALFGSAPALVAVANPLTEDATHLRSSLLPGLIDALRYNLNHGARNVRLYETGRVFAPRSDEGAPSEEERLGIIAAGDFYDPFWQKEAEAFRFHHLKALLGQLGRAVDGALSVARGRRHPFLHPGVEAAVLLDGEAIGWIGELHPDVQKRFKFPGAVFAAEISLDSYRASPLRQARYQRVSRFPVVDRDLSFLVDSRVEFSKIRAAVQALNIGELKDQRLIDLYQGPNLPPNKVSLTVRLTFADPDRTLTQDEVGELAEQVARALQQQLAVEPRS